MGRPSIVLVPTKSRSCAASWAAKPDTVSETILAADAMMESLDAVHVERIFTALGAEVRVVRPGDCTGCAFGRLGASVAMAMCPPVSE